MEFLRYLTLRRLAKALYGIVAGLLIAEVAIGIAYPQQEALQKDLITRDSDLGFRMVPNYRGTQNRSTIPLLTNSWGLRDREYGAKNSDTLRVYAIGDSMVFGHGVPIEETFTRYLEVILADRVGRPVEVVNGGVPGYGTVQEVGFFERTVEIIEPDVVLLSVAVFNDINDNVKFGQQLYRWQRDPTALQRLRTRLRHSSQLYRLFRRYRAGVSGQKMMQIHAKEPGPAVERGLQLTEEALLRLAADAKKRGIGFGIIINPAHKQASAALWADTLLQFNLDGAEFEFDQPNRRLVDFAEGNRLSILDLLPTFRSRPDENFYFSEHWKAAGHRLVANEIADFLLANEIVSTAPTQATNGDDSTIENYPVAVPLRSAR